MVGLRGLELPTKRLSAAGHELEQRADLWVYARSAHTQEREIMKLRLEHGRHDGRPEWPGIHGRHLSRVARLLFTEDTLHLVEVLYARTLVPGGIGVARPPHGSKDRCGLVRR